MSNNLVFTARRPVLFPDGGTRPMVEHGKLEQLAKWLADEIWKLSAFAGVKLFSERSRQQLMERVVELRRRELLVRWELSPVDALIWQRNGRMVEH